ncbi:AbrB/MazE/SpoVT family DNA-binding domain-containing protein [Candidatus Leptofilum sp.]|uniref:AbrB/MazE/SpoVT family DNA-binding domain-containing protein n=1 Tax=Candidatus Leptofilum sp. TaxID=3241576 RepID=UPI003B5B5ED8
MSTSTITTKGQVTIPKKVRKALHLKAGDQLVFVIEEGKAIIYPSRKRSLAQLRGALQSDKRYSDYDVIRQATAEQYGEMLENEAKS